MSLILSPICPPEHWGILALIGPNVCVVCEAIVLLLPTEA